MASLALGFYLFLYPVKSFSTAIGSDTPVYVWWARYAGVAGLGPLGTGSRPGVVGMLAALLRVTGASPTALVEATAPVLGASLGLAAGALVDVTFGRDRMRFTLAGLFTATYLSLLIPGYVSTLAFGALFLAALVMLSESTAEDGWRAVVAAGALLGAAGLAHPIFLTVAALVLVGAVVALLPGLRRDVAAGKPLRRTGVARIAFAAVAGGGLTVAGLAATVPGPVGTVDTSRDAIMRRLGLGGLLRQSYRAKLAHDMPWYRVATLLALASSPLARLGAVVTERSPARTDRSRLFWGASAAWILATIAGIIALLARETTPGQRLAAFCLPIPMIAAVGIARVGVDRSRLIPGAVLVAGTLLFLTVAWLPWGRQDELVRASAVSEASRVGRILGRQPVHTPLIVVVDVRSRPGFAVSRYANVLRAAVPPARIRDVHVFLGSPADLLSREPLYTGNNEHDAIAGDYWRRVEPLLDAEPEPLAVVLKGLDRGSFREAAELPDATRITRGVYALPGLDGAGICPAGCGPETDAHHRAGPGPVSPWEPVWLGPLLLLTLAATGFGWAAAALPGRPLLCVALAPALGCAAIGVSSVMVDAAGIRLGGWGGGLAVVIAVAGGITTWRVSQRGRTAAR